MLITIVTYNPDVEFVKSTINKIRQKDKNYKIFIIDNHSKINIDNLEAITDYFVQFDKNYGLGRAYNYAIKFAKELKEEYVMFLDQDTVILENFNANKVVKEAKELEKRGINPYILSINIDNTKIINQISNSNFYVAKLLVNSGIILQLEYAEKNLFLEDLFLDRLDFEYIYRAIKLGIKPLVYKERMLSHKPGEGSKPYSKLCGKLLANIMLLLHNNDKDKEIYKRYGYYSNFLRYYLMLRNDIYLWLRRKIYFNFWKMIIGDLFILCEVLGYRNGLKWILRAIKYGITGNLKKDNEELFLNL